MLELARGPSLPSAGASQLPPTSLQKTKRNKLPWYGQKGARSKLPPTRHDTVGQSPLEGLAASGGGRARRAGGWQLQPNAFLVPAEYWLLWISSIADHLTETDAMICHLIPTHLANPGSLVLVAKPSKKKGRTRAGQFITQSTTVSRRVPLEVGLALG
jgi:hypothetical protein